MRHSKILVGLAASVGIWAGVSVIASREARAATCTWQSTSSSSWSTAANWSCGAVPTAADDAVFPAGASLQTTIASDGVLSSVKTITVTGGAYNFNGPNTLYVGSQITSSSSFGPNFQVHIQAAGDLVVTSNALGGILFQSASLAMGAHTLTLSGPFEIDILSTITGTGQVTKNGAGLLFLSGTNTFTGPMAITAGIARLQNALALGPSNGATTVSAAGKIQLLGSITLVEPLVVNGGGTPTVDSTAGANKWNGPVTLTSDATFADTSASDFTAGGAISGVGHLAVTGNGVVVSSASNTFSGGLLVSSGSHVTAQAPTALGAGLVTVATGGSMRLEATGVYPNAFSLSGSGSATDGALTVAAANTVVSGVVTLATNATVEVESGGFFTTAKITGAGALTKTGALPLTVNAACNYAGATTVSAGTLKSGASGVLPATTALDVANGASLDLNGHDQSLGALTGAGTVTLGSGTLTFGDATNATFAGNVQGTGGLVLHGTGTKVLTGSSTHSGATTIMQGTVHLQGAAWTATNVVLQGGTFGLSQAAAAGQSLTATGGTFAPGFAVARDGASGNVALNVATTFSADVTGTATGQHTHLATTGTVSLGGSALVLTSAAAPIVGNTYLVIDNDGVDPIVGTFATLPEGAALDAAGGRFKVSYVGGTGNDLVLTVVEPVDAGVGGTDGGDAGDASDASDAAASDGGDAGDGGSGVTDAGGSDAATSDGGGLADGGSPSDGSTPSGDGAIIDAPASADDSGCGCRTVSQSDNGTEHVALLGLGVAFVAMIRRRSVRRGKRG